MSAVRVGYINDELILNPTMAQLENSQLNVVVTSTKQAIVMIEADAREASEDIILQAIKLAHEANRDIINLQEQLFKSELPMLKKVLFKDLRFSVFMGRNRYICLNKFYKIFPGNVKIVEKMEHWIKNTKTGIKSEEYNSKIPC